MGRHARWRRRCAEAAAADGSHAGGARRDRRDRSRLRRFVRARLHRRIFLWFGASILLTGAVVVLTLVATSALRPPWRHEVERMSAFVSSRFERVWDDPVARAELADELARELDMHVVLEDRDHRRLGAFGDEPPHWRHKRGKRNWRHRHWHHEDRCPDCGWRQPVKRDSRVLGFIRHNSRENSPSLIPVILVLAMAGLTLWAASGVIARRIVRPMHALERTARELGSGNMSARVDLGPHHAGEVGVVADAVNEMADRIEEQMADQRELLATVSHEMRTPLGHMRVLVELARDGGADPSTMDELEQELVEADGLIGELLASSRLEFDALTTSSLDAVEVAEQAVGRAGLSRELLQIELDDESGSFQADPTLLARALANILRNARTHGEVVTAFRVERAGQAIRFVIEDAGPGFADDASRVFETFYRGNGDAAHTTLGLGLSLVDRIARAHDGRAGAENLAPPARGARVWIELPAA